MGTTWPTRSHKNKTIAIAGDFASLTSQSFGSNVVVAETDRSLWFLRHDQESQSW